MYVSLTWEFLRVTQFIDEFLQGIFISSFKASFYNWR